MAKKKAALCVINPVAGRRRDPQGLRGIIMQHVGTDYDVSFCITSAKGDAAQAVLEMAPDTSLLICCGGDGTLNELVTGMWRAGTKCPVLFLPCGTTNDIARALDLPPDPGRCVMQFAQGRPVEIDAGLFNQSALFTYIAAFGAFTEISYGTSQPAKNKWGYLAYLAGFFKGLVHMKSRRLTAQLDDGPAVSGRYLFGSVTNSLSIGGVLKLDGQSVSLGDGRLELLLIERPKNILLLPYVMLKLLLKKYNTKGILLRQCTKVSLRFEEAVDWTIDGEYGGKTDRVDIENLPQFYQVFDGSTQP